MNSDSLSTAVFTFVFTFILSLTHDLTLILLKTSIEPVHEKNNNVGSQPGLTQTGLYSDSIKLWIYVEEE